MNVGEDYKVVNSDQTAHNIHPEPNPDDREHSVEPLAAAGISAYRAELEGEEVAIPVKCNIHPWMHGYMA